MALGRTRSKNKGERKVPSGTGCEQWQREAPPAWTQREGVQMDVYMD